MLLKKYYIGSTKKQISNMRNLLTFLFILITSVSFAQIKFEPGYFISNNNTKTECLIKNSATYNNPVSFEYKLNEEGDVLIGKINDIKEFAVGEGYHYKRFEVNVDQSSNVAGKFSTIKDPEWKKEITFLKLLVQSDVNLYQYENANQTRYFISSGNHETAEQLVFKEYVTRDTGSSVFVNNFYRRQLFVALKSPNLQQDDFEKLKYNKDSLMKLFLKYSNQEGKTFTNLDEKQNKSKINLKVNVGVSQGKIAIADNIVNLDYNSSSIMFRIGFETELILPFGQKKWALFIDPNFQMFKNKGNGDTRYSSYKIALDVDYQFIQIPIGVRHYLFLNNSSKLFFDAGVTANLTNGSSVGTSGADLVVQNVYNRKIENSIGAFCGFGYNFGKYSLEARYNFKNELFSPIYLWTAQYSTFGIIASYNFL
ncbi:MAG: hypothetical protein EOO46_21845 [Flavobacterium sp.]|nr:MAG: hypothetical protein EOO46_21845 [Flavobacterium sp.]